MRAMTRTTHELAPLSPNFRTAPSPSPSILVDSKPYGASTNRWKVLLKYSPLALKKESDTRWSSRREAVTVVHRHLDKIVEAFNHLPLDAVSSPERKSVSVSLLKSVQTFELVAFICFW
ncbi:hypothetical protein AVEN_54642-1 [Araneus ventricosus]|uniref:Uncharacterized protein n=1 Tax=Araneus ventricosus TaxID=182803 RepID=A0A4Y2BNJ3_ARAVE|nr:hypothetical protein AVEN_54642-1 [Araneus ventricosus]